MLRSKLFFAQSAYRSKIKSPVDFVLGIVRGLRGNRTDHEGNGVGTIELARALEGLGQRLFYPPSVAGWEGGRAWLNGQTFLLRQNLALALTSTSDPRFGRRLDPANLLRRHDAANARGEGRFPAARLLARRCAGRVPRSACSITPATPNGKRIRSIGLRRTPRIIVSGPCAIWYYVCRSFNWIDSV